VGPRQVRALVEIAGDREVALLVGRRADGYAVGGPLRRPGAVQPLSVHVAAGRAVVGPGDDRPTRVVADDHRRALVARGVADHDAVGGPLRRSERVDALRVDVARGRSRARVLPDHDDATRAVGHRFRIGLVRWILAHWHAVLDPGVRARRIQLL